MKTRSVRAWTEKVIIPTYELGKAEKNPIFLENRVYQGSSGSVYPHPVIEKISDEKVDKEWLACWLENDYIKIMILPELGGRVQMAYDKLKKRHFVYYNHVIKPALVGLTGPWISGGIEFNWPQHHRPSTYQAVDYSLEDNPDGSKTIWCGEIEKMFRTQGLAGFTLHPDKAYLEIKVKLYNTTPHPQTFLWWANPAVAVNEDYQSVFPPDVHAVFDHGKRDVSRFPIATGTYYKMDYSAGVDISKYKNIPVPTSYMAIQSKYNFVGGYENDSRGGLLHVANHHISPGKKQWTWGNGDFGKAWDRNLTDNDGPYIELMCGVYTDNQPDFAWLMPYEEKSFTQYFMPYRDVGVVKNASKEALINLEFEKGLAHIKAFTTSEYPNAHILLTEKGKVLLNERFDFHPDTSFDKRVPIQAELATENYRLTLKDVSGRILIEWQPEKEEIRPLPDPAKPAKEPAEIISNEELYLQGQHLEQYRHATYDAAAYYREALDRDPDDVRNNNALGLWKMRKGLFIEAEKHFRTAYSRQIQRNPNPYNGEALFNLGMALRYQDKEDEAFTAFYKSVWNAAWMDAGYFQLAQIASKRQDWEEALDLIDRSLIRNWHNHKARQLKVVLLRKLNRSEEARELQIESMKLDPLKGKNLPELALDYYWAGLYSEAIQLLDQLIKTENKPSPLHYYYKGWMLEKLNLREAAIATFKQAENCSPDYCFPNQLESVIALECAMKLNPNGSKAPYYLGNFWYHSRQYHHALSCWERSAKMDQEYPTVYRNLALAYYNKFNSPKQAQQSLEKAFALDSTDSRVFMELDLLYKKLNWTPQKRLAWMEKHPNLVSDRDDLYLEKITLLNLRGEHEKAYQLLLSRNFHPWEGGEGKVTGEYKNALIGMAQQSIALEDAQNALDLLNKAKVFPDNLGEGKLQGALENDISYWMGCAYFQLGQEKEAIQSWNASVISKQELSAAWFYNDQQPDQIYYQGLALLKLERKDEAMGRFNQLIDYGEKHLFDQVKIDYFAVSLPDLLIWEEDLEARNHTHCQHLIALGTAGKIVT